MKKRQIDRSASGQIDMIDIEYKDDKTISRANNRKIEKINLLPKEAFKKQFYETSGNISLSS